MLSLLVVNYRSAALAIDAIRSARAATTDELQVVVVDNSCDAAEADALRPHADVLLVSDLALQGGTRVSTTQMAQAIAFVLREHGFRAGLLEDARRMSLYKQLSNRKWPDRTRWREREPGFNYRDTELPRMLGKMIEVGFGSNASLDLISDNTGYWPRLLLQQLVRIQLFRSTDSGKKSTSSAPVEANASRIVSLKDWRREESNERYDQTSSQLSKGRAERL